jgi:hypothetical protein
LLPIPNHFARHMLLGCKQEVVKNMISKCWKRFLENPKSRYNGRFNHHENLLHAYVFPLKRTARIQLEAYILSCTMRVVHRVSETYMQECKTKIGTNYYSKALKMWLALEGGANSSWSGRSGSFSTQKRQKGSSCGAQSVMRMHSRSSVTLQMTLLIVYWLHCVWHY